MTRSNPRARLGATAVALFAALTTATPLARAGDQECAAVMAWGQLQMFERGPNGKLMYRAFDADKKAWGEWVPLTGREIASAPSALLTDGGTRLAVFFRGTDGKLQHVFRDKETGWSGVIGLGDRELRSGPTAVIADEVLTVFARGVAGKRMKIFYDKDAGSWTDWSDAE